MKTFSKGSLCIITVTGLIMLGDGAVVEKGDKVIVLKPRSYTGAKSCLVYNQRMKQKQWINKNILEALVSHEEG